MKTHIQNLTNLARLVVLALLSTLNSQLSTFAQGTAFTYQGRLTEKGAPANGSNDFTFTLYNAASAGATVGMSNVVNDLTVTNGLFTAPLDFPGAFDGNARWLQIAVRPGASAGAYTNLVPRQPISATPYAIRALNAGSALTASSVAAGAVNNQALANDAVDGGKILNGSITGADLDPNLLNNTFWRLGGNSGNVPGPHFVGTTDDQPLELKVFNQRGLRLEPAGGNPNVIGGYSGNVVNFGFFGATIGGGGSSGFENRIGGDFANVGGGKGNTAGANSATVSGGERNTSGGPFATVSGGSQNISTGDGATVPGGSLNFAGGNYSFAAGYRAKADHIGAFVWADSTDADFESTGVNQFCIRARGGIQIDPLTSQFFGAQTRQFINVYGAQYGIGVQSDTLYFRCDTTPNGGFIWYKGGVHHGGYSQPGAGGTEVMHLVDDRLYVQGSVVVDQAGLNNGSVFSKSLTFGMSSGEGIASRRTSGAPNQYGLDFYTGGLNRMTILNDGRVGIGTAAPASTLTVIGDILATGNICANNGAFCVSSDRNVKAGFEPVNTKAILEKVAALPITRWHYTNDPATPHLGAVAQDFHAAFAVGMDDKHIATVDADGVALAALQGLNQKVEEKNTEIRNLRVRLEKLEQLLDRELNAMERK